MTRYEYPEPAATVIEPMTEASLALQLARDGGTIREAHGRPWRRLKPGFYAPVHWLARLTRDQAKRPGPCWGFIAGLDETSADHANASIPIHVIPDIDAYGLQSLPRATRRARRRLDELGIRIVGVTDDRVFRDQGYEVMREWRERKGLPYSTRERYLAQARGRLESDAWFALAALQHDALLGYTWAWSVDHAAYLHEYAVLTSAMTKGLRLSALLNFEAVTVLKRSDLIREVSAGLAQPEQPGALAYKLEQGYPIKAVPARLSLPWPVARFLRASRPASYYRLTGIEPQAQSERD